MKNTARYLWAIWVCNIIHQCFFNIWLNCHELVFLGNWSMVTDKWFVVAKRNLCRLNDASLVLLSQYLSIFIMKPHTVITKWAIFHLFGLLGSLNIAFESMISWVVFWSISRKIVPQKCLAYIRHLVAQCAIRWIELKTWQMKLRLLLIFVTDNWNAKV